MASKSESVTLKKSHFMGLLLIFGLVIGLFAGYYIGLQHGLKSTAAGSEDNQNAGGQGSGITITREDLFYKYANDLNLDKAKFELCLKNEKYSATVDTDSQIAVDIGATGTPTFIINGKLIPIGAAPYAEFKKRLDAELASPSNRSLALSLINTNDPTLGKKDAPIVMLEFSDFQCPFCGKFFRDTFPKIKKDYIDTGKVYFVYKDFPLSQIHAMAHKAAEAGNCANEQGKFWEYHNKLFENQVQWAQ